MFDNARIAVVFGLIVTIVIVTVYTLNELTNHLSLINRVASSGKRSAVVYSIGWDCIRLLTALQHNDTATITFTQASMLTHATTLENLYRSLYLADIKNSAGMFSLSICSNFELSPVLWSIHILFYD